jgi:hypothetical protein
MSKMSLLNPLAPEGVRGKGNFFITKKTIIPLWG